MTQKNKILKAFFEPLLNHDIDKLKQLKESIILKKGVRYFDWTASGLASSLIEKRISKVLPYYANTHSKASNHASLMVDLYEKSKEILKKNLELTENFAILSCGFGATSSIKKFQEITGIYIPSKTKQFISSKLKGLTLPGVLIGPYEHHSNEISWREGLCEVQRIPLDKEGKIDLNVLEKMLSSHQFSYTSFSIASNVTGILSPYETISTMSRKYGAIPIFDMASSSAYMNIEANLFDAAFLSPHKLLGGIGGSGLLIIKKDLVCNDIPPSFAGGGVIKYANRKTQEYFNDIEIREEAGTPGLLQVYRAALAYQIRNEYSLEAIRRREHILTQMFLYELKSIPALKIYGNDSNERLGIVSFNIAGISPYDLAFILSNIYQIETRAGCSCAGPYGHDLLQMKDLDSRSLKTKPGWLRVSLHYTHSLEDIEYLLDSLKKATKKLRGG
ncbi:aminotransferase class V-fold PLP-dependent enzyme [Helicobacter sp. 13S00477-4]|uniref:aminotransferase class V-fold PLP-dependent enzyme n=1 Tax=Helicobacter sp. 13S00477-4 TaxID=1905759 RepID=UPI000BA76F59|nr:aminotransferase class V-fold PLP-dependent enzyme [Helicobacter sp. 13S00477-4]PAF52611.1 cysteine desulfurase [Helicobacter sp. 13S00477-4]